MKYLLYFDFLIILSLQNKKNEINILNKENKKNIWIMDNGDLVVRLLLELYMFDFETLRPLIMSCKYFYNFRFSYLPLWKRCDGCLKLIKINQLTFYNNVMSRDGFRMVGWCPGYQRPVYDTYTLEDKKIYGSKYCAEKRNTKLGRYISIHQFNGDLKIENIWRKINATEIQNHHKRIRTAKEHKKKTSRSGSGFFSKTIKKSQTDWAITKYSSPKNKIKKNNEIEKISKLSGSSKECLSYFD